MTCIHLLIRSMIFFSLVSQKWHVESHLVRLNTHIPADGYNYYNISQRGLTIVHNILLWFFFPRFFFFARPPSHHAQCVSGANRETACTLRGRLLFLQRHTVASSRAHNVGKLPQLRLRGSA